MPELRLAGVRLTWFIGAVLDAICVMHTTAGPTKPGALTDALATKADPKKIRIHLGVFCDTNACLSNNI